MRFVQFHTSAFRHTTLFVLVAGSIAFLLQSAAGAPRVGAQPFADLNADRVHQIARMLPNHPSGFGVPCSDRATWSAKAQSLQAFIAQAERIVKTELPPFDSEGYLAFTRTGDRAPMERNLHDRADQLMPLVLAECTEYKGRFLPRIAEVMDSLAAQPSWTYSAHDPQLLNFKGIRYNVDLNAADMGDSLAETLYLLGDKLPQTTHTHVMAELERHVFAPMRLAFRPDDQGAATAAHVGQSWMRDHSNWNAVCLKGVTGAALAVLPGAEDRAIFVAASEHYIQNYESGFSPDGYDTEGLSYWNYGFSHFLELRENLLRVTRGRIDLLTDSRMQRAALFGLQFQMLPGNSASFGDAGIMPRADANLLALVERLFKLPQTDPQPSNSAAFQRMALTSIALDLFPVPDDAIDSASVRRIAHPSAQTYYDDSGVLVSRPAPGQDLAITIKAGGNTTHSHNDIGSFTLGMQNTQPVGDPGGPSFYNASTFGPRRLDSRLLNSFGHPVPQICGELQLDATKVKAIVTAHNSSDAKDSITIDMTGAYAIPALKRVTRTMEHSRTGTGTIVITDEFTLQQPCEIIESLPTHGTWTKIDPHTLLFTLNNEQLRAMIDAPAEPTFTETRVDDYGNNFTRVEVHVALSGSGKIAITFVPAN